MGGYSRLTASDHPRVRIHPGKRITRDLLPLIRDGYTANDIVREYPEREKGDVDQATKHG